MSELDEKVSKETDQWNETVEEITNQRLVKAQIYMKRFSNRQQHSKIKETSKSSSEWLDSYNNESSPMLIIKMEIGGHHITCF